MISSPGATPAAAAQPPARQPCEHAAVRPLLHRHAQRPRELDLSSSSARPAATSSFAPPPNRPWSGAGRAEPRRQREAAVSVAGIT